MSNWDLYVDYFVNSPLGGTASAIISSVFIVGLCAFGLILARRMYNKI